MRDLDPASLAQMPLPADRTGDKETRGRVLIIGGSLESPGGAMLAGIAALRAGAGKLQVAVAEAVQPHVAVALPEAMVVPMPADVTAAARLACELFQKADAAVVGPGMMDEAMVARLTSALLKVRGGPPLVLDAAALAALRPDSVRIHGRTILTPHAGEMARLSGWSKQQVEADPLAIAREIAARYGAVVAMKGACTYVVAPDGTALRHPDGVFGLATSGSGDTLAGVMGGLLARGASTLEAAAWGVYLHGQAGVRLAKKVGPLGFLAREILDEIAPAMAAASPAA